MSDSVSLWTVAHQAPLSMEFSRQEYWSDSHSLLQGIFLTQGSSLDLTHYRQFLYHLSHQGSPNLIRLVHYLFMSYTDRILMKKKKNKTSLSTHQVVEIIRIL